MLSYFDRLNLNTFFYLLYLLEQSNGAVETGCAQIAIIIIMLQDYSVTGYYHIRIIFYVLGVQIK